ncbi:hypothetical protein ACE01N_06065 [Saccharicrinis sp. FJH2]|uniref:hypothetical protein n=1 Tax=Saccharicrinis sp. FJH65 TaxID=3344659 RepID=UPI0035F45BA5
MKSIIKPAILFFIGLIIISNIPKLFSDYYWANTTWKTKINYLSTNNIKPECVFIGSSRVLRQINPEIIDSVVFEDSLQSFNLGSNATFIPESFYLYKNFIKTDISKNLKYVVIELGVPELIGKGNFKTSKESYFRNIHNTLFSLKYIEKSDLSLKAKLKQGFFHVYAITNNILGLGQIKSRITSTNNLENQFLGENYDGFFPLEDQLKIHDRYYDHLLKRVKRFNQSQIDLITRKKYNSEKYQVESKSSQILFKEYKRIVKLSNQKGVKVIFLIPPRLSKYQISGIKQELANQHNDLSIIDLSSPERFPDLYKNDLSFDIGHLNNDGSKLMSLKLAAQLKLIVNSWQH